MPDQEKYFVLYLLVASIVGYLAGSISFARIITFLKTRSLDVKPLSREIPESDIIFVSDSISATAVNDNLGSKFGCLVSILDMIKVGIPTWIVLFYFSNQPFYLIVALFGIVGHNYPLFYKFKGGRGMSPLIGGLVVINWMAILIANMVAAILSFLTGTVLIMRGGWTVIIIFWFAWYYNDTWHLIYIIGANALFWISMVPDLKKSIKLLKHRKSTQEEISDFMLMGKKFGRFFDKYSLPALIKKLFN